MQVPSRVSDALAVARLHADHGFENLRYIFLCKKGIIIGKMQLL